MRPEEIFDQIDISNKEANFKGIAGQCSSCLRDGIIMRVNSLCMSCNSFVIQPSKVRFAGILFATPSHSIAWVRDQDKAWSGPDITCHITRDLYAESFNFIFNYKCDEPYIFAIKSNLKSSFELSHFRVNHDPDLIVFSGETVLFGALSKETRFISRSAIMDAMNDPNRVKDGTNESKFVEVMQGARKAWTL